MSTNFAFCSSYWKSVAYLHKHGRLLIEGIIRFCKGHLGSYPHGNPQQILKKKKINKWSPAKGIWTCKALYIYYIIQRKSSSKNEKLLKIYLPAGHPRWRWVCFFIRTDLEIIRITSPAHKWIICSEWVSSEWESKQRSQYPYDYKTVMFLSAVCTLTAPKFLPNSSNVHETHVHLERPEGVYIFKKISFLSDSFNQCAKCICK